MLVPSLVCVHPGSAADEGWKQPLRIKEQLLEQNILERHNILGLCPSMVQILPAGQKMEITTATPFSDVVHVVAKERTPGTGRCGIHHRLLASSRVRFPERVTRSILGEQCHVGQA